ncbi:hypothetical protein [Streptomyces spectabilis]|uniref:Uncharacterized protein n=1 Tax=Streptomyces spectabilis TaxID=68270 RepID=A0A7W8EXU0_STRST|nr:hypothetical protein [Streptomyces spectabilis]MBB5109422.1 hypothetical protein [Streptomyces spectabilis]MCI3907774.1 hypothetical protein [Streptomyces spectabilis]GGV53635.1 hypothetical protein GCM10010245_84790 [Streptomyces spectabilis]
MQRTPRSTQPTTVSLDKPAPARTDGSRLRRWLRRRRAEAALHLLRGLCYGLGTGLAGLGFYWLQQHL